MIAVLFALSSLFFSAIHNVIIKRKLAQLSPLALMLFSHSGVAIMVFCIILFGHVAGFRFGKPHGNQYWFLTISIALLFLSSFSFYRAYYEGASLMMMTTLVVLLPVFTSLVETGIGGSTPSLRQIAAWFFAAIAVLLVSRQ